MTDRDTRGVSRVLPDLPDDLLVELFHRAARRQWTSRDFDWAPPLRLSPRQRQALAHLLSPVYFGEQTAMAGASAILPQLMRARESSAQVYLASFIMDEARHFEALTRLYRALGTDPLGLRDLPELLVYHHRIRQGDRADWVWGILFSDVIAKHFYRAFGLAQADPLLAGLARRILQDESRHLAFAEHYLRRNVARMEPARRRALLGMRDDLYRLLLQMTERVRADAAALDIDADVYLGHVWRDVEAFASRIGLSGDAPPPPGGAEASAHAEPPTPPGPVTARRPAAAHDDGRRSLPPPEAFGTAASAPFGTDATRRPDAAAPDGVGTDASARSSWHGHDRMSASAPHGTDLAHQRPAPSSHGGGAPDPARPERPLGLPECFGCLLTLLCARRLGPAPA